MIGLSPLLRNPGDWCADSLWPGGYPEGLRSFDPLIVAFVLFPAFLGP